jgi:hypothetical protein
MCEEFDSIIQATDDDDNDDVIDIVIVTNQRLLNEVTRHNEHEMLSPSSTVYIDSTAGKLAGSYSFLSFFPKTKVVVEL